MAFLFPFPSRFTDIVGRDTLEELDATLGHSSGLRALALTLQRKVGPETVGGQTLIRVGG